MCCNVGGGPLDTQLTLVLTATQVNPSTFMNVLGGIKKQEGDKVVPVGHYKSLVIGIYAHGWSHSIFPEDEARTAHAKYPCDICGQPHRATQDADSSPAQDHEHSSLFTREWFFHCPHNHDDGDEALYSSTAHSQHEHHTSLVYWSMLFQVRVARVLR